MKTYGSSKRSLVSMLAVALVVAACGGEATSESIADADAVIPTTTTTTGGQEPTSTSAGSSDTAASSEAPSDVAGVGEGTATINGETRFFGDAGFPALRCEPDMFGIFFVFLQEVDESGAEVSGGSLALTLLLEGTDPEVVGQENEAHLKVDDQDWIADPEDIAERGLEAGMSQVDSYTVTGNSVSGTATFYEEESYYATTGGSSDPVVTMQGSFEVTCADE
jgi:hypothetical protein